jgi:hypothetical protein
VIGIIVPARHGIRLLLDDLQVIIDAPKALETLKTNARAVGMALASHQAVKDEDWELLWTLLRISRKRQFRPAEKSVRLVPQQYDGPS